jgi:hypothetical protein
MQFAKDSFFLAVRERLAGLNPKRVVTLDGTTIPAVVVTENLPPTFAEPQPNTFYIEWGAANVVPGNSSTRELMSLEVVVSYYTSGTVRSMVDRGRMLAQLDDELLRMCRPANVEKMDYTTSPTVDLGTRVFWNQPSFAARKKTADADDQETKLAGHDARLTIYFFPEVTQP